jgi:DHA1 family bicyclomycin/chloramphenicol resistance-like MFS transporter
VKLVLGNRASVFYTLAMMVLFGALIAYVGMVQQIFSEVFHRPQLMPSMFALCAIFMGICAYGNSRFVERLGMRKISHAALLAYIVIAALHTLLAASGYEQIWSFVVFQSLTMACFSLAVSNFGAMAMEPVGRVAGVAASLQGFISTFTGALLGAYIGRQFNGTLVPVAAGALCCGVAALVFVLLAERGRLFAAHHSPLHAVGEGQMESAGLH